MYEEHSRKINDQFFCEYGVDGTCCTQNGRISNESDYKIHIIQEHAFRTTPCAIPYRKTSDSKQPTDEWNFYSQSLATVINDPRRARSVCFFFKL